MARQRQTALSAIPEADIQDGPLPGTRVAKMPMDDAEDDDGFDAARLQEDALPAEGDLLQVDDLPPVPGEEQEEAEAQEEAPGEKRLLDAFERRLSDITTRQQRAFDQRMAQLEEQNLRLQQEVATQRQQDNEAVLQHQLRQLRTARREAEQAQDYARAEQIEDRMEALRRDLYKAEAAKTQQPAAKKPGAAAAADDQVNPDDPFARQLLEDRVQQFRIYYDVTDSELRQVAALEGRMAKDPRWAGKPYQMMWKSALQYLRGQSSKRGRQPGQPAAKPGARATTAQRRGPDPMGIREAERQLREISERRKKAGG
jgi:hypothetical protein